MPTISDPNRGLDPYAGSIYHATLSNVDKQILSLADILPHIDSGLMLEPAYGNVITYGFFDGNHAVGINNNPHNGEGQGYSPFSAAQMAAAATAIGYWDDLIPESFVNTGTQSVSDWAHNGTEILLANTTTGPAQAWTYYPGGTHNSKRVTGDVWTATPDANGSNGWLRFGGYGMETLIHELGHSLGLSHPGKYNFGPNFSATYANGAEYAQDSRQYSIMSYWSDRETNALVTTWNVFLAGQPQTPMVHDIYTIQTKYGADMTTRATDTTYGFNSTAGKDVYDFNKNPYPMLSVYDAGGNHDLLDLSGFTVGQFVDLHPGSFSSIGGAPASLEQTNADRAQWNVDSGSHFTTDPNDPAGFYYLAPETQAQYDSLIASRLPIIEGRIAATTGVSGITATEFSNFSIAYATIIEDATGGSARDLLWGNDAANILKGMDGNDVLKGFGGNDTLWGGNGDDTFVFANDGSRDTVADFQSGHDKIDVSGIDGATSASFDSGTHTLTVHTSTTDVLVTVLGDSVNTSSDIIFHA